MSETRTAVKRYGNRAGNSGVTGYECTDEQIAVRFKSGETYVYTRALIGKAHLAAMKRRAEAGRGLSTYINQHPVVREGHQ